MEKPLIVANLGRSSSVVQEGEGVSRDDIAAALMEVVAGRIPLDRIALKELAREVKDWPYLDAEEQLAQQDAESEANYEGIINTGLLTHVPFYIVCATVDLLVLA